MRYRLLKETLEQLSASLLFGSDDARLRVQFALCNPQFISDYYYTPINHPELKSSIERILDRTDIGEHQKGRFKNAPLNIYEFLQELEKLTENEYKRKPINAFIKFIEEKNKTRLILKGTFIVGVGVSVLSTTFSVFSWPQIQMILSATLFFPVVGLASTAFLTLYGIYQNEQSSTPFWSRVRDNTFLLANSVLNMAAYVILLSAASALSPVASGLFIAASCIKAIKESCILIQHLIKQKKSGYGSAKDLMAKQTNAREMFEFKKHRNALVINLTSAVIMVGIMAFWSLVPGGFVISAVAIAAMGAVALVQSKALSINEKNMKEQLNNEFERLEGEEDKEDKANETLGRPSQGGLFSRPREEDDRDFRIESVEQPTAS